MEPLTVTGGGDTLAFVTCSWDWDWSQTWDLFLWWFYRHYSMCIHRNVWWQTQYQHLGLMVRCSEFLFIYDSSWSSYLPNRVYSNKDLCSKYNWELIFRYTCYKSKEWNSDQVIKMFLNCVYFLSLSQGSPPQCWPLLGRKKNVPVLVHSFFLSEGANSGFTLSITP